MTTPHTEKTMRKFNVQSKNTDPFSKNTELSVSLIKKYLNNKEIVRELKINDQELLKCYQTDTDEMAQKICCFLFAFSALTPFIDPKPLLISRASSLLSPPSLPAIYFCNGLAILLTCLI